MDTEEWRPIPSFPGYEASSLGRIRSTPPVSKSGKYYVLAQNYVRAYLVVQLNTCKGRVNRLVCEAFNGPPPSPAHEAAHMDNDHENNTPSNLQWQTSGEN